MDLARDYSACEAPVIHSASPVMASHHTIDYIEFSVTDMERTKSFYAAAFGWRFTDYAPGYVGIRGEDREVGGFALADAVPPGGPLVVLHAQCDLEQSYEAVVAAGGTIVKQPFAFPGGRRFHFSDPSGNVLAVWTKA